MAQEKGLYQRLYIDLPRFCRESMKQRRVKKMVADLERWRREGNRPATVEKSEAEVAELHDSISQLWERHLEGLVGGPRPRHSTSRAKGERDQCHCAIEALELIPKQCLHLN